MKPETNFEKYINERGQECYRGVTPETVFSDLAFHNVPSSGFEDIQFALHTNMGSITVLDRLTGFSGCYRDTETGYRDTNGKFWLASGMQDVRKSGCVTMQEAIDWIKKNANTCRGE